MTSANGRSWILRVISGARFEICKSEQLGSKFSVKVRLAALGSSHSHFSSATSSPQSVGSLFRSRLLPGGQSADTGVTCL